MKENQILNYCKFKNGACIHANEDNINKGTI